MPIPVLTMCRLEAAPCLRRIILASSVPTTDRITGEVETKAYHEDIAIRRWHLSGGVFTWAKSWSHIATDDSGDVVHMKEEVQQDWVDLGGQCLTSQQLEEICRLEGVDRDWDSTMEQARLL